MREFNKVNPSLWGSKKFGSLSHLDRLLYLYFLSCVHSNSCGLYRCPVGYITSDLKLSEEDVRKGIDRVSKALLIEYDNDEDTVFLYNWFKYNPPVNPKHAQKVKSDILSSSSDTLKDKCLKGFDEVLSIKGWSVGKPVDNSKDKGYQKGIGSIPPQDQTRPKPDRDKTRPDSGDGSFRKVGSLVDQIDQSFDIRELLKDDDFIEVNSYIHSDRDRKSIYDKYNAWIKTGKDLPKNPKAAFIGWLKKNRWISQKP